MLVPERTWRVYEQAERALTQQDFQAAQKELDKAVSTYANSPVAWCLMGTLHEEQLQLDEAFGDYSQAISVDPYMLRAYLGLARIAFRRQRWQEVAKFTDQLANLNPIAFPSAHLYSAAAHFNLGDLSEAEKEARKFQSLDTEHERPQVYSLLGDILAREHNYMGAAEQKRIFLKLVPDADDANHIKEQIRMLEDRTRRNQ